MIENIAIWGGVAGLIVSIFAVIILFLTRHNILDILDKDVILFDKNFELKKEAISKALELTDQIYKNGKTVTMNANFDEQAKKCYNDLICVVSDIRVAEEFYNIAFNENYEITEAKNAQFKLMCRKDIGLTSKKSKILKHTATKAYKTKETETPTFAPSVSAYEPMASSFTGIPQPTQTNANPTVPSPRPAVRPQAGMPPRPTQPRPAVRPQGQTMPQPRAIPKPKDDENK